VELSCSVCPNETDIDLSEVHEPDRICWSCKSPWVPRDYEGRLIVEDEMAWEWLLAIDDAAGHWTLSRPAFAKRYANDMRGGWWEEQLIGFPGAVEHAITFDCHGRMLMGVVRCLGCIDANVPFRAVLRTFDPIVPGGVDFDWRYRKRGTPSLLNHWKLLRERRCSTV